MKTIAIVTGGNSSESEISVQSANEVKNTLASKYELYIIMIRGNNWYWEDQGGRYHNVDKNDFSLITDEYRIRFDAVFIAMHGTPGENGLLQGYFDMMNIPYSSCGAFCSGLAFNKHACKLFLKEYDIPMAEAFLLRNGDKLEIEPIINKIGFPCFVKPNDSGSSFGITKVKAKNEFVPAIEKAFKESNEVLIESFMKGREVSCGVVKTKDRSIILPITELCTKNEFFDYEAKYLHNSIEITPADLSASIADEIQSISSRIYDLLGCKGIVRIDFIIIGDKPSFLEINTIPGMTKKSLIPQQAEAAGIPLDDLYSMVIEDLF